MGLDLAQPAIMKLNSQSIIDVHKYFLNRPASELFPRNFFYPHPDKLLALYVQETTQGALASGLNLHELFFLCSVQKEMKM